MTYEEIKDRLATLIPFNSHIGIEIVVIGDGTAQACLPKLRNNTNHLGLIHAAATFGVGEAAAGCAIAGLMAEQITNVRSVASSGAIEFHRVTRNNLFATANLTESTKVLRDRFAINGKLHAHVMVTIQDDKMIKIADLRMEWHIIRRNK